MDRSRFAGAAEIGVCPLFPPSLSKRRASLAAFAAVAALIAPTAHDVAATRGGDEHGLAIGPDLGADSIRQGTIASIVATLAVMGFMLVTYGRFGVYATAALLVNALLIPYILSAIRMTPAIIAVSPSSMTPDDCASDRTSRTSSSVTDWPAARPSRASPVSRRPRAA